MSERIELLDGNQRPLQPRRLLYPSQVELLLSRGLVRQVGSAPEFNQVFFRGSMASINAALRAGVRGSVPRAVDCTTTRDGENGTEHKWRVRGHAWRRALVGPGVGPPKESS
jgi:hypothetical protein